MPLLELNDVNVSYGDVQVLYDVSLHVNEGEVVSIIGGNGAGKTTLLRTISGLLGVGSGAINFEGAPLHTLTPEKIVERGVVQVPEGRKLFHLMTVFDNLIVGAYNRRANAVKDETLKNVYELFPRLKERTEQLAMTLSGGEQQMVAIGRGMMACPKLLMLDEPSLGLAPILMQEIFNNVRAIADQGATVLLVEQDVKNSLALSDRAYVLEHGRVAMEGEASHLMNDPHVKTAYLGL
ncbi:ABC transporter ATP-binding protein [Oceanidesulfovibrio marinus]|uniref:ABC transporter ATP-binding protein n=1 Tax=Oceanidesulfovibrio marinus TaxID=370038 RepID=A0A6P1ZDP7_9BACT|nr:ABC transporter ATP-binding protein [Oceanidesulfovibrio marinus]QJT09747.1 ABC transporter ATP-binding protein [Oceanidesulfovibrio marinus]TVM31559.1 branched-chain amino acid ABC transporter ATP-binding protein [Oceanidesulfovibrio marinus]